jgi:hypothetical protein
LLTKGSWTLLWINYGTIFAAWFLDWMASELEQGVESEHNPAMEVAEATASPPSLVLILGAVVLVLWAFAIAKPGAIPTWTDQQAATTPPVPTTTSIKRPVSMNACVADSDINLRRGPGTQYEVIGGIRSGACMSIRGRNPDSSWVYIVMENNQAGWVAASLVSIDGDVTRLAIQPEESGIGSAPTAIPSRLIPLCFELANRLGQHVSCKIDRAECIYHSDLAGSSTLCNDRSYPDQEFQLVVTGEDWSNYDDSCIVVSGYLETSRGLLQIQGFSRSQVSYCE